MTRRPRLRTAGILTVLVAAAVWAAAADFTLYRIPRPDGKTYLYTDRKPTGTAPYKVVGDYEMLSRPVALSAGPRKIIVYYPKGTRPMGAQIAEDAWYAVRLQECFAGFPFPQSGDVKIYKVPEADNDVPAELGRSGIMASDSHPFLMYHEVGHYWMNFRLMRQRWQAEGMSELGAYVVGRSARGVKAAEEFCAGKFQVIRDYEGEDFPIDDWDKDRETTLPREQFAYAKAFVACSLLLNRVGLASLQAAHRQMHQRRQTLGTRDYLALLETVARTKDLDQVIRGWVLPGGYVLDGKAVSLREYVLWLEKHPPTVPAHLEPPRPVGGGTARPTSSSRPTAVFLPETTEPATP